ncbi:bleomycin resistance protein [Tumebacillus lipolyticus]|uniref:Bleomycin resistance protein n=1 Tax=Tumebacillus lipolyticus TaxID=1280370 RepID=A0ABW4ZWB8_9BACL
MEQKATFKGVIPVLIVEDLDAAMAFYTEKLGFAVTFTSEWEYHGVNREGMELHIGKGEPNFTNTRAVNVYFIVENIEALYQEFLDSGAITSDVQLIEQPYGARELHLRDPFGYHLGFSEFNQG